MEDIREEIEWCNIRWFQGRDKGQRALLIGDSITLGYSETVRQLLEGRLLTAHLCTSKSIDNPSLLKEINYVMQEYPIDVIHFNNGLHGWHLTAAEYGKALTDVLTHICRANPGVSLIWASTTQSTRSQWENSEILRRNQEGDRIAHELGLPVDPLFEIGMDCEKYLTDGIHYRQEGYERLGASAAESILKVMADKKRLAEDQPLRKRP